MRDVQKNREKGLYHYQSCFRINNEILNSGEIKTTTKTTTGSKIY